jgi:hypothetical protein
VIYVASSDPRRGGFAKGDLGLDTNGGILSRLTWNGSSWDKQDLVRGLPRSEVDHVSNALALDPSTNTLYLAQGGNTDMGAPSSTFGYLPEVALSAAILKIDLNAIGNTTYDLPTLDDPNRPGTVDANDPFGGDNGLNQAKLVPGGPVQIYSPGYRNPYDLIIASNGNMYATDNASNAGEGGPPINEGPAGNCTNDISEPGWTEPDSLHIVTGPDDYGGHPNPTRGNMANTFAGQSPVSSANPIECDFRSAGTENGALTTFGNSTNGLAEYTASDFGGAMKGNLLAAGWNNLIHRIILNASGTAMVSKEWLFQNVGSRPLDVTAQGDNGPFPGTIWVADFDAGNIIVYEPWDYGGGGGFVCTGQDSTTLDEDGDGYSNADEIDNGTSPCSAGDTPPDWDHDFISNLNDPDDDNDGLPDISDPFAIDSANGASTNLPVSYTWDANAPPAGGLEHLGFTGLMTNGTSNYASLYNPSKMTAGGAGGVLSIDSIPGGDAYGTRNSQQYGFQFGVNVGANSSPFEVHTSIESPFGGITPQDFQSMGLFFGDGTQDNYVKIVTMANGGGGGVQTLREVNAAVGASRTAPVTMPGPSRVDLYLDVYPSTSSVQPMYAVTTGGVVGPKLPLGPLMSIPAGWFTGSTRPAVGVISTSYGPAPNFAANWGQIEANPLGSGPAFSDDFSGGLVSWTTTQNVTLDSSVFGTAAPSAKLAPSGAQSWASKTLPLDYSSLCMSAGVRLDAHAANVDVLRFRTRGGASIGRARVSTTGKLLVRDDVTGATLSTGVSLGSGWHTLRLCATTGASGSWTLSRDGVSIGSWAANNGTVPIGRIQIGDSAANTYTMHIDDVSAS